MNFTRVMMYRDLKDAAERLGLRYHPPWIALSSSAAILGDIVAGVHKMDVNELYFPPYDWQKLNLVDGSFGGLFSDQVLEHVARPWLAIAETRRVLRMGGVHVCTTCSFNPLHKEPEDYWRFTITGLKELHKACGFRILHAGSWGSKQAVSYLASGGNRELSPDNEDLAEMNDPNWPIHVWVVAEKIT